MKNNKISFICPISKKNNLLDQINKYIIKKNYIGEIIFIIFDYKNIDIIEIDNFIYNNHNNNINFNIIWYKSTYMNSIIYALNSVLYDDISIINTTNINKIKILTKEKIRKIYNKKNNFLSSSVTKYDIFLLIIIYIIIKFINIIVEFKFIIILLLFIKNKIHLKWNNNINRNNIIYEKHKINHIALILDGNRRYSKNNKINKEFQHYIGFYKMYEILNVIKNVGIKFITIYAFSEENWKRDENEIKIIMSFIDKINISYKLHKKNKNGIFHDMEINILSTNKDKFNKETIRSIDSIHNIKKMGTNKFTLNICLNYGGRQEINNALIKMKNNNKNNINEFLLTKNCPDLDVMVRFGKVKRISNFLLYQLAYTEIFFVNKYFPEVVPHDIYNIIEEFNLRKRNFGK
jgi:undecaprenyl diphosphate synthase